MLIRNSITRFLVSPALLLCWSGAHAQIDLSRWEQMANIRPPESASSNETFARVSLPGSVLSRAAPGLRDIRLVDDSGAETPYVLTVERSQIREEAIPVRLLDRGVVPGRYQQVVCDIGMAAPTSNEIRLETSSQNFRRRVDVLGSPDRQKWVELKSGSHVFDQHEDIVIQNLRVIYPETTYRYLQLRIRLDGGDPLDIRNVRVLRVVRRDVAPETVAATISRREEVAEWKATDYHLEISQGNQYLESCVLEISQPNFRRRAEVAFQDKDGVWRVAGSANIYRFSMGESVEEMLRIGLAEFMERSSRLRIHNRDNPSLEVTSVRFERMPRVIVFQRNPQKSYRLVFANPAAERPSYDLDFAVGRLELDRLPRCELDEPSANPEFKRTEEVRPWTERNPALLWTGLILGVAILGWMLFRTLREMTSKGG